MGAGDLPLPRVTFTNPEGETLSVSGEAGVSVMRTAKRHGIPGIRGDCGGFMQCATCHVYVDPDCLAELPPLGEDEDLMLDGTVSERTESSRLSCQLVLQPATDLRVWLPEKQI